MINWLKNIYTKSGEFPEIKSISMDINASMRTAFSLHQNGELIQASVLYEAILKIKPDHEDSLYLLGLIKSAQGNNETAKNLIEKAININNKEPAFHKSLGDVCNQLLLKKEACHHYENAKTLDSVDADTFFILGSIYEELGQLKKAEENLTHFLKIHADSWQALSLLGEIYLQLGQVKQAIEMLRKCHKLIPDNLAHFSSYLFSLNFDPELSADYIFSEHLCYQSACASRIARQNSKDFYPKKKLRIGYISPDFRSHPVSRFVIPVLEHHNHDEFEIFCYYNHPKSDEVTEYIKSLPLNWRNCAENTIEKRCHDIENDDIDILVDLAGHTSYNNLEVFLHKSAAIQTTWLGYINTTGLESIDYRIVDAYSDPVGVSEKFHSESLLRLPNSQWCYQMPEQFIEVSALPALAAGYVCFGSLNRFAKLSSKILSLWVKLLSVIPDARLLIVGVPYDKHEDLLVYFHNHGVKSNRLEVFDAVGLDQFRALHHRIDIALDSHPYSGATTTCDSIWMGVPVLTLTGETSISRSTSSILQNIGLNDWIAEHEDQFIKLAIMHVNNLKSLSKLRANLRVKLESSPMMDAAQFTMNLEKAYREIWIKKCNEINN